MTTRNKILLSVGAVCLVAVIAVVAVVAVFAARTQNVTSNITVKYTAQQVVGKVSAKYYVGAEDTQGSDMYKDGGSETEISFTAGQPQETGILAPKGNKEVDLSDIEDETKIFVIFEYKFTNSGEQDYKVSLQFTKTNSTNVKVYAYDQDGQDTVASWSAEAHVEDLKEDGDNAFFSNTSVTKKVGQDTVHYFYIVVAIEPDATGSDAEFSGSFAWTLTAVPNKAA